MTDLFHLGYCFQGSFILRYVLELCFFFFLLLINIPSYGYTNLNYPFICYRHLGYFHFLAITNNAAMNACIQVFVWAHVSISVGYIPRSGIIGSFDNTVFNILGNFQAVLKNGCTILLIHSH